MRYFIDTEFLDTGSTIELISIGMVSSDGREYYAQSCDFKAQKASKWVQENVFPHLRQCPYVQSKGPTAGNEPEIARSVASAIHLHRYGQCIPTMNESERWQCPWRSRPWLAQEVRQFIDAGEGNPEFWGWITSYDFVALCQLFGAMMDLPAGFPHYIRDLQYILDERDVSDDQLPQQEGTAHNALEDARHIKRLWEWFHAHRQDRTPVGSYPVSWMQLEHHGKMTSEIRLSVDPDDYPIA